jgi:demethylmenaquinone methyltransferase/2-methoxy-6-polyprenyl-1,4-benzoquinol methylase
MFDGIVDRYDLVNRLLSFGLDRRWRVATVDAVGARAGDLVLDLGSGTGDLATLLTQRGANAVGVDLSHRMLTAASAKLGSRATLVQGSAYALPFPDGTFSGVVSGFVLRNLDDLPAAFSEIARVLAPGGRVALVDITEPRQPLVRRAFDAYFRVAAPALGRLAGKADAYRYLVRSLAQLPPPDEVCRLLRDAGLAQASSRSLTGGIVTLFTAVRTEGDRSG